MHIVKLNLKKRSYKIIVGSDIIKFLAKHIAKLDIGSAAYIITNKRVKNRHGSLLNKSLVTHGFDTRFRLIPDSEESKSIKMADSVIQGITHFDKNRKIFIVAFGGGVVGDLAGFVSSIYKRGIDYIQVPTTLLSQVDSSIGGKTGVDLAKAKNLVGAFYQPKLVFSDVKLLKSLNPRQLRSGLAEVIKYGIIKDPKLFVYLEKKLPDILALKNFALEFVIKNCSQIKARIVQEDEREEKSIRTILNFGHTLGHAIEAAGNFKKYNHGEAIALGMLLACDISRKLELINNNLSKRIEDLIKTVGLPTKIEKLTLRDIIIAHYHDKKFIGRVNRFVLIKGLGKAEIVKNIPLRIIKEAIKNRM